ncbi:hypothetical protein FNL37_1778 [Methylovorus glucosotrophus]|nr:hypothetical protein FNL37_1778 [Methylovorus glucosotrophus]
MSNTLLWLCLIVIVAGLIIFGLVSKTAKEPIEDHYKIW